MPAVLELTPEERTPFAYILALEVGRLQHGTREHQEIGEGLRSVLEGVTAAADGPLEVELANDEMYMLGVRNHVDASELEEYWLDNRASMRQRGDQAPFPDEYLTDAVTRFYPEVLGDPESWNYADMRPIFTELGFKIDRSVTEGAPRVRGLYNKERAEIIRRTRAVRRERAEQRGRLYPRGVDVEAWRRLFREGHLAPGEMTEAKIDSVRLLIANVGDRYYAVDGVCTHAPELGTLKGLAAGELDADSLCITCPWHGAQYNLRSGRVVRQPYAPEFNRQHLVAGRVLSVLDPRRTATDIRTYDVKIEDGYVWVNVV